MAAYSYGELQREIAKAIAGGATSPDALASLDGAPPQRQITAALSRMMRSGMVQLTLTAAGRAALEDEKPFQAQRPATTGQQKLAANGPKQRAWRSMRIRRTFTLRDLISDARQDENWLDGDFRRYLRQLKHCGYVHELPQREFRLVKDTGPVAPVHSRTTLMLTDHNTGEAFPCPSL